MRHVSIEKNVNGLLKLCGGNMIVIGRFAQCAHWYKANFDVSTWGYRKKVSKNGLLFHHCSDTKENSIDLSHRGAKKEEFQFTFLHREHIRRNVQSLSRDWVPLFKESSSRSCFVTLIISFMENSPSNLLHSSIHGANFLYFQNFKRAPKGTWDTIGAGWKNDQYDGHYRVSCKNIARGTFLLHWAALLCQQIWRKWPGSERKLDVGACIIRLSCLLPQVYMGFWSLLYYIRYKKFALRIFWPL